MIDQIFYIHFTNYDFKLLCRHPAIVSTMRSLAVHRAAAGENLGTIKITAYDTIDATSEDVSTSDSTCDLSIFPDGIRYLSLPVSLLDTAIEQWIFSDGASTPKRLPPTIQSLQEDISRKVIIFVCTHGSRDTRCGVLGTALAQELLKSVKERGLQDVIEVFATSHIGGHKYAGNVLVYGRMHPSDGDWYGGLHAEHAESFLDALLGVEIGVDGGAEDAVLRQWWRGRMGLSKEEQVELWESGGGVESGEDAEEEER